METFIHLIYTLAHSRFLFLLLAILVIFSVTFFLKRYSSKILAYGFAIVCIWCTLSFFIFGNSVAHKLVHKYGKVGSGVVLEITKTNNLYNEEPVLRYSVIYKKENGQDHETFFETWDFNLYPEPKQGYVFPTPKIKFDVKYLEKYPSTFIILTEGKSPFAKQLNCSSILKGLNAAKAKREYNKRYEDEYKIALKKAEESGCLSIDKPL